METNKNALTKEQILRISGVNVRKCMRCGKCSAICPSYGEMEYHPHQFVYMIEAGEVDELMRSESIYKCLSCFACLECCPRGVEPSKLIEAVRVVTEREKGCDRMSADDIPAKLTPDMPGQLLMSALRKYRK